MLKFAEDNKGSIDVIVLDIKLDQVSGLDVLQKLVKAEIHKPVILHTGYLCYKDDFSAWLADGYVLKSSNITELRKEIDHQIERFRIA